MPILLKILAIIAPLIPKLFKSKDEPKRGSELIRARVIEIKNRRKKLGR